MRQRAGEWPIGSKPSLLRSTRSSPRSPSKQITTGIPTPLTQIADEQPRFSSPIAQLEDDLDELIAAEKALRSELTLSSELQPDQVRTRQLLADLDARYRVLRAREADLVFEAFHLDIGGKG